MATNGLEIKVGADVGGAVNGINQLNKSLKTLPNSSGQATQALTNFSRVVQDAPFGIIGVANNIDPLIQSFNSLKASTGSTGQAFKLLASSLVGPAGLALAVSAVTSLLVTFAQKKQKAASEAKALKEEENVFVNTLAKEKVQLDNLFSVATNANVPLLARKEAINGLRENYGAYLKDFSDEEILAGKAALAYEKLSAALINVARARAAQAKQEEITRKILDNEEKILAIETKAQRDAANARPITETITGGTGNLGGTSVLITAADQIKTIYNNAADATNKLRIENIAYQNEVNRLSGVIIDNQVNPLKEVKIKTKEAAKEVKKSNDDLLLGYVDINGALVKNIELIIKQKEEQARFNAEVLKNAPKNKPGSQLAERLSGSATGGGVIGLDQLEGVDKLNKKLFDTKELITNGLNGGIDTFFNALANNQDPLKALAQSAQRLVVELGAAVVKMLLLKAISTAITGGGSLAGGALSGAFGGGGGLSGIVRSDQLRLLAFSR